MKKFSYSIALFSLLLAGCVVGPQYQKPDIEVPCKWQNECSVEERSEVSLDQFNWWKNLNDAVLDRLIDRIATQNLDLQIAATRVILARSEANAKRADLYPHVDASASYTHVYYSKDALVNGLIGTAAAVDKKHVRRNVDFFEIGFDAFWEFDFFGMTEHQINALKAKADARQEAFDDVWITLSAEVARNYIELRAQQNHLSILRQNLEDQNEGLQLLKELMEKGVVSQLELKETETEINLLASQIPEIELGIRKAIHRLSVLLGYSPGELHDELNCIAQLPCLPECHPTGVPSDLLRRRPDIRRAEHELAAATEQIGSAIAALFPRFSLAGFIGEISTHCGSLFSPASAAYGAGPQLLFPIFNSKLLLEDVKYNKIVAQQAIYEYQKSVLVALEEVENALASYQAELRKRKYLTEVYRLNVEAVENIQDLFERGLKDYIDLMRVKRSLSISEEALIENQTNLIIQYIALHKALGGSWCVPPEECE